MKFAWNTMGLALQGRSIVDAGSLGIETESEAYQFLLTYGFDWYDPAHVQKLSEIYHDAIRFLNDTLQIQTPVALCFDNAVPFLQLLTNKDSLKSQYRREIRAILRVVHVLIHLRSDLRLKYLSKIRKQTIGRIESHIQINGDDTFLGFETDKVRLMKFEKKDRKVESSVILKLLLKAENVAQEIYDYLGVRFVSKTRSEAVWIVNYLLNHHLISAANLLGARCRNTLASLEDYRQVVTELGFSEGTVWTDEQHLAMDRCLSYPTVGVENNRFSSMDYHAIQLTSRPLIRIPVVRKGGLKGEISFFFPMEIQILDEDSYLQSRYGQANHKEYKQKQLEAVRRRVLGDSQL